MNDAAATPGTLSYAAEQARDVLREAAGYGAQAAVGAALGRLVGGNVVYAYAGAALGLALPLLALPAILRDQPLSPTLRAINAPAEGAHALVDAVWPSRRPAVYTP